MTEKKFTVGNSLEDAINLFKNDNNQKLDGNPNNNNILTKNDNDIIENHPKTLTKIKIKRYAYEKMKIMAQEVSQILNQSMEVYALCIGDNGIISDILIPQQKVSSVSIHIEASNILSLSPKIRAENLNIIGWVHSHGNMSVFFSSTDDNNQIVVLHDTANYTTIDNLRVKYCFGITINLKDDIFGIVTTQFPSGKIIYKEAIFEILDDLPLNWNEVSERKQISDEIKEKVENINLFHDDYYKQDKNKKNNENNIQDKEKKESVDSVLYNYEYSRIDRFLKKNNISDPKIKKNLIEYTKFLNFHKKNDANKK